MDAFAYIIFVIAVAGPLVAYAIYTSFRGEPRRPDKPTTKRGAARQSSAS